MPRIAGGMRLRHLVVKPPHDLRPAVLRHVEDEQVTEILAAVQKAAALRMPVQPAGPKYRLLRSRQIERRLREPEIERRDPLASGVENRKRAERFDGVSDRQKGRIGQPARRLQLVAFQKVQRPVFPPRRIVQIAGTDPEHPVFPVIESEHGQTLRFRIEDTLRNHHFQRSPAAHEELPFLHQRIARKTADRIALVQPERILHHDTLPEGQHRIFAQEVPADGNAHGVQRIAGGRRGEFGVGYGGVPTAAGDRQQQAEQEKRKADHGGIGFGSDRRNMPPAAGVSGACGPNLPKIRRNGK